MIPSAEENSANSVRHGMPAAPTHASQAAYGKLRLRSHNAIVPGMAASRNREDRNPDMREMKCLRTFRRAIGWNCVPRS